MSLSVFECGVPVRVGESLRKTLNGYLCEACLPDNGSRPNPDKHCKHGVPETWPCAECEEEAGK